MLPALDKRGELFSLLIAECHDVLLNCVLFAGHESAPSLVTGTSIQRTRAESMTDTTRHCRDQDRQPLASRAARGCHDAGELGTSRSHAPLRAGLSLPDASRGVATG